MSLTKVFPRSILLTAAAMLCFAANSILCRLALAPGLIDAASFTTVRVFCGAAMLSMIVYVVQGRLPRRSQANVRSATSLLGYLILFSFAYTRLDAGSGALILIGAVQITMFAIAFLQGERFQLSQWAGLGLALLGFVYLMLPGVSAPDLLGAFLMALSGFSWGCFSVAGRNQGDPVEANAVNLLFCLVPVIAVNLMVGNPFGSAFSGLLLAAVSGAVATGFGYIVWYAAIRDLPIAQAATVQLSLPALVSLGGAAFLSEPITLRLIVATAVMLSGIALVLTRRGTLSPADRQISV